MSEVIAVGADHAGFELKSELCDWLRARNLVVLDFGTHGPDSVDYPDFGVAVGDAILGGRAARGLVVCGTGVGISIAVNRRRGLRAALCQDATTARLARAHNDANVLALGARIVGPEVAKDCLAAFLETPYEGGRHDRRIAKLDTVG